MMRRVTTVLLVAAAVSGCARYQLGPRPIFCADIRTVYVPMFRSESFQRRLGERLTEAVVKEIHRRTPYRVVSTANADSALQGRIASARKSVLAEDRNDAPRVIETDFVADVSWIDRNGSPLMQRVVLPVSDAIALGEAEQLLPESGQSLATSQQNAIRRLATQIVDEMEKAW